MRAHGLDVGTWFLGGVVAGLVLLSGAAMADDTQGAKPKRAVAVRSSRVTTLLAALEKADTAEQAATLLRNAKLNDAELAELEREVGTPALDFHEVAGPTVRAICEPRNIPLLCLVGETNRSAWTQWELENGWTVEDSWLDVDDHGANAGGYWDNQPARDASRVRFRVVAWADAYSMVEVRSRVLLRGPRGTSHQ
jgi:hypothetical protein